MNATVIAADSPLVVDRSQSMPAQAAATLSQQSSSITRFLSGDSFRWDRGAHRNWLLLFATIAAFGFLRCSIPSVNEPHYLCKARAFWDASYCPGDFFLDSFPVHFAFYVSVGWLTVFLPLTVVAVVARTAAYVTLAVGFSAMLSPRLGARGTWGVVSASLALACVGNFSGEWLVGGIESKCFAYGLIFCAVGKQLEGRWTLAATLLGLAIAFHPIVGLWSASGYVICVIASVGKRWISSRKTPAEFGDSTAAASLSHREPTRFIRIWQPLVVLLLASLPGVVPAVVMMSQAAGELGQRADQIQFSQRLGHHLDPRRFPAFSYELYAAMLGLWCLLMLANRFVIAQRGRQSELDAQSPVCSTISLNQFTAASVLIAAVGLLLGWNWPTPAILKFYPFRLADALLPIATCATCWEFISGGLRRVTSDNDVANQNKSVATADTPLHAATAGTAARIEWSMAMALCGFAIAAAIRNPVELYGPPLSDRLTPKLQADLMMACKWISVNAAPDAVVLTPSFSQGFKWYASRAEYVCFKDCPQDAAGIIEWSRRRRAWTEFFRTAGGDGFSGDEFRQFAARERFDLVLAHEGVRIDLPRLHHAGEFVIYTVAAEGR